MMLAVFIMLCVFVGSFAGVIFVILVAFAFVRFGGFTQVGVGFGLFKNGWGIPVVKINVGFDDEMVCEQAFAVADHCVHHAFGLATLHGAPNRIENGREREGRGDKENRADRRKVHAACRESRRKRIQPSTRNAAIYNRP